MLRDKYDVCILGGGPVGITAALKASSLGRRAILIDATPPRQFQFTGPTGLFSKALRDAAMRLDVRVLREMGLGDAAIWAQVNELVQSILRKAGSNNAEALVQARVPHLRGFGVLAPTAEAAKAAAAAEAVGDTDGAVSIDADGAITVDVVFSQSTSKGETRSTSVKADNVLLCTGSKAVQLDSLKGFYNLEGGVVFDSDSIKSLSFLPRSVVIVGGGIIAVEFARIFAAMAARVTMIIRAKDLPSSLARVGIDRDIGIQLQRDLQSAGVRLLFCHQVTGADEIVPAGRRDGSQTSRKSIALKMERRDGEGGWAPSPETLRVDMIMTATGRGSSTAGLNLEGCGVQTAPNGDVMTRANLQTAAKGVYAAGDIIGAPQLASTGIAQAESAIEAMFGVFSGDGFSSEELLADAARFPIGIWTIPETSFCGLTKEAAEAQGLEVVEGIARYSDSIRGHVHSGGRQHRGGTMQLKLVCLREAPHVVVGVHIFGDDACELVHYGTTLVQGRKTLDDVLALTFAAVTYHELFKIAALDAMATIESGAWRALYTALDRSDDGDLKKEEVRARLLKLGAGTHDAEEVLRALFRSEGSVQLEDFVTRAMKLQSPLKLDL